MRVGILLIALAACRKPVPPPVVSGDALAALQQEVADPLRGRFSFKIDAEPLGLKGSTGGALIVDRPGRLHFAVLGPLGAPLATAQTDGERASIELRRDQQHFWAEAVEQTVRDWTGGELGVDDVVGMFLGQVPLPDSPTDLVDGGETVSYSRGDAVTVTLAGSPLRPSEVRIVDDGVERLRLRYDGWEAFDAGVLPSGWALTVPALELSLDVRFKSFEPIEQAPDVFGTAAPPGFSSASWQAVAGAF